MSKIKQFFKIQKGLIIAITIISLWINFMIISLNLSLNIFSPITYLLVILMTHLYTGLFITAHDAMHHSLCENRFINDFMGKICTTLFAFNSYKLLKPNHFKHHRYVVTIDDPDYYEGNFFSWYYKFLKQYVSLKQIILESICFNLLILIFSTQNVILFWVIPSLLSTFQLFYFGTYMPHRGTHEKDNIHKSNTLNKNHSRAFVSCYFFGYHYEHHDSPKTPWWGLYRLKK